MGVGGSTNGRPGTTAVMIAQKRPQTTSSVLTINSSAEAGSGLPSAREHHRRPTDSCCSHFRVNHTSATRNVTPAAKSPVENLDDEIEEIVANTLDIVSNNRTSRRGTPVRKCVDEMRPDFNETNIRKDFRETPVKRTFGGMSARKECSDVGSDLSRSSAHSQIGQNRTYRSHSRRSLQKRPSMNEIEMEPGVQYDAKDSMPEVDFAKFKKVNNKGATLQKNGRIIHHQESDLLWRLGLISPEAYTITTGTRSAPSNHQGPYLKTPSYDLTEEQLMANIEKEFECTTAM